MSEPGNEIYKIAASGTSVVLTASGANALINQWSRQDSQMWLIAPVESAPGWYRITDKASGLVLDGPGAQTTLSAWSNSTSQMWSFSPVGEGYGGYKITQQSSGNSLSSVGSPNATIQSFNNFGPEGFEWDWNPVILHVVVVMMENRSFDNVLGYLYGPQDKPAINLPPLKPGETEFHGLAFENTAILANNATVNGQLVSQPPEPIVRATNTPGWDPGEEFAHVNTQLFGRTQSPPVTQPHYIDIKTGLTWLLLTVTRGLTFPEVSIELGPRGFLANFRRASNAEVLQLFGDSGITYAGPGYTHATPVSAIQNLINTMGVTTNDPSGGGTISAGFTANYMGGNTRAIGVLQVFPGGGEGGAYISNTAASSTEYGHWLVQKTAGMKGFLSDYAEKSKAGAEFVEQIMHSYTPADAPILNTLARGYAVSDSWFCSVPTQTNANRAFSLCGTSLGLVDNGFLTEGVISGLFQNDHFKTDTIWNVLHNNGMTDWKIFWHDAYPTTTGKPYTWNSFPNLNNNNIPNVDQHFVQMDQFYTMASAGQLPAFSYIEPSWGGVVFHDLLSVLGNEYHPPEDITPGEAFLQQIYQSLTANPAAWAQTMFLIVFDEHGGTYDHVPPPYGAVPPWGYAAPTDLPKGLQHDFAFNRFGVRVPAIVCSPLVEESTVFRADDPFLAQPFDHCSIIATVLEQLLPTVQKQNYGLGERVANAPTFSHVLTRNTARTENVLAPGPAPAQGSVVQYGESFYLKNSNGSYVTKAVSSNVPPYYYPQLGTSPIPLCFRLGWGNISSGSLVQIRTYEMLKPELPEEPIFAGIRNMLGAWATPDCYYWSSDDTKAYTQLSWTIEHANGQPGPIVYGDKVYLTNIYYSGQRLTAKGQYLTTAAGATDYWIIMPAPAQP